MRAGCAPLRCVKHISVRLSSYHAVLQGRDLDYDFYFSRCKWNNFVTTANLSADINYNSLSFVSLREIHALPSLFLTVIHPQINRSTLINVSRVWRNASRRVWASFHDSALIQGKEYSSRYSFHKCLHANVGSTFDTLVARGNDDERKGSTASRVCRQFREPLEFSRTDSTRSYIAGRFVRASRDGFSYSLWYISAAKY